MLVNKPSLDTADLVTAPAAALPVIKADSIIIHNSYISFIDEIQQIRSVNSIGSLKLNKLTNAENVNNFKGNYLGLANANRKFTHVLKAAKDTAAIKVSMNGKDTGVAVSYTHLDVYKRQVLYPSHEWGNQFS